MGSNYNAFDVVTQFEQVMAEYTGAKYAVAVDSCTAALFLGLRYHFETLDELPPSVWIPRDTFVSVPMAAVHAGFSLEWREATYNWQQAGWYWLLPVPVVDAAVSCKRDIFHEVLRWRDCWQSASLPDEQFKHVPAEEQPPTFVCLSFQYRKQLPIGRGGMILHNDAVADEWFRRARFFGRHAVPATEEPGPAMLGWHMYMEPERAAKGLSLMMHMPDDPEPPVVHYPDLSKYSVFEPYLHVPPSKAN